MRLVNENSQEIHDLKPPFVVEFVENMQEKYARHPKRCRHLCPACDSDSYAYGFEKYDFHYVVCKSCNTLYVQNILNEESLKQYQEEMREGLYQTKQYRAKVSETAKNSPLDMELFIGRYFASQDEISVAYFGSKAEIFRETLDRFPKALFSENPILGECQDDMLDLIIINNTLELTPDPKALLALVCSKLKAGGYLLITGISGNGIDILTLWEDSNVYPLEHMNLLSPQALKQMLDECAFELKQFSTPGVLDMDFIMRSKSPNIPRFLQRLQGQENHEAMQELQMFIQKNLLSSHLLAIAKKKVDR